MRFVFTSGTCPSDRVAVVSIHIVPNSPPCSRSSATPHTRAEGNHLTQATRRFLLYHTDIAAVVNEMAGQALMLHQDRCTKNYYMHHDIATGLWRRIPW
jgi:hypothetical protein